METVKVSKGQKFLRRGERVKGLYVILQGSVRAVSKNDEFDMEAGSIIGLMESGSGIYLCDYIANTECICYSYDYKVTEDYKQIFTNEEKYVSVFTMSAMRQTSILLRRYTAFYRMAQDYYRFLMNINEEYKRLCNDYEMPEKSFQRMNLAMPVQLSDKIENWTIEYYEKMSTLSLKTIDQFLMRDFSIGIGEILNAACWMTKALSLIETIKQYLQFQKELLLSNTEEDMFELYFDLAKKAAPTGVDLEPLFQKISEIMEYIKSSKLYSQMLMDIRFSAYKSYDFYQTEFEETEIWAEEEIEEEPEQEEERGDYLTQILAYSRYDEEKGRVFRAQLEEYKNLPDILSTSDDVRKLRRQMTQAFYEIYELAFWRSVEEKKMPTAVKMFLNFGLVDERLAGEDNASSLHDLVDELYRCKADNVFTMYEWLLSILRGENEPCRNEFDLDYTAYLNELKKTGKITADEQNRLSEDLREKVQYEMRNMFVSTNRATYGKISTFCPVLCEHDIINSVESMLVTAEKINEAIDSIRQIDFSLFYREVAFSDPERDINREMIQKEVLPNVILLPNAGNKAMMWQETAGIKKDTPARFVFPIMTVADVTEMMIEVSGRFRWEMCRKIQGVRWNDITEPSLTSEYNDYIQYYRKNHELSPEAREKVKNALYKAKNNFREVFVKDYQNWIKYESKGSFRLNKVSRDIIFRYCPFSKKIRKELVSNPMYRDIFEKYEILKARKIRHQELWYDRYEKKGGEITPELQINREFYEL